MSAIEILKDLVVFNTVEDKENNLIIDYIKRFLEERNFSCEVIGKDRKILYATIKKNKIFVL